MAENGVTANALPNVSSDHNRATSEKADELLSSRVGVRVKVPGTSFIEVGCGMRERTVWAQEESARRLAASKRKMLFFTLFINFQKSIPTYPLGQLTLMADLSRLVNNRPGIRFFAHYLWVKIFFERMIGQYLVVKFTFYTCTPYSVMGPTQYIFAATRAACSR